LRLWRWRDIWVSLRRVEGVGASMRYVVGIAIVLMCSGCANNRTVTFKYYPGVGNTREFPLYAEAECGQFGQNAVPAGSGSAEYGSATITYRCDPK
jgi:hypothetical protein